jgi:hypothetical protein
MNRPGMRMNRTGMRLNMKCHYWFFFFTGVLIKLQCVWAVVYFKEFAVHLCYVRYTYSRTSNYLLDLKQVGQEDKPQLHFTSTSSTPLQEVTHRSSNAL